MNRINFSWRSLLLIATILIDGCVDPYRPPAVSAPNTYLVVDGFLNGSGVSSIRLTRTQNLSDGRKPTVETKATVKVEGEKGGSQTFVDKGDGTYTLAAGGLQFNQKYRLSIKTAAGRSYQSDYVTIKQTPKIDNVSWKAQDQGVQFYVTTHDPTNNTKYYRWEYEETWEFYSAFYSRVEYQKKQFVSRMDDVNHCWSNGKSTGIFIGSSEKLTQDVINQFPLVFVSNTSSNRLKVRYSLLVKQYAQTAESFEYWQNLRKNTESLGSIFDPQPFQVIGNLHGVTDPNEPVVGYLSGYSVEEKRIFVNASELPPWRIPSMYEACLPDTAPLFRTPEKPSAADQAESGAIPIDEILSPMGQIIAYRMSSAYCVDCRTSGTNVKPTFW
ncbi:DUF4249 domain-containing protein [Larkinella humicola]|uniref:DUF4249 domain-containing protein n=1 Tax=Larkinella humicola TaxID=2607654 RepID=A0A5N1JCM5_9BACT|nr:DUF4249 domain-containing protein [Larkinella humicola]KAA9352843.1 DUF4249 domain-containing protein [Larkinella humicola]